MVPQKGLVGSSGLLHSEGWESGASAEERSQNRIVDVPGATAWVGALRDLYSLNGEQEGQKEKTN